jgi:hypothetical protein
MLARSGQGVGEAGDCPEGRLPFWVVVEFLPGREVCEYGEDSSAGGGGALGLGGALGDVVVP